MRTTAALWRALVVSALPFAVTPAFAASGTTEIYLANLRIAVDVLAGSARMVETKSQDAALKRVADAEATHQGLVLAALDGWRARQDEAAAAQMASLPLETGRSVAIDSPVDVDTFSPPPGVGVLMAGASATLDRLSSLDGTAFDELFKTSQLDRLKALEGLYEAYSQTGDNAALRGMAKNELGEVRAEIAALGTI